MSAQLARVTLFDVKTPKKPDQRAVDAEAFGARLISLRQRRGFTQAALNRALDINANTAGKWERWESLPDADNILRLAELLRVTTDYLLSGGDEAEGVVVIGEPLQRFLESDAGQALTEKQRTGLAWMLGLTRRKRCCFT